MACHEGGGIPYRVLRTDFLHCASDVEYLAKLHCLREAFTVIMEKKDNKDWWVENGRTILCQLLVKSDKDPKEFLVAFEDMLEFCMEDGVEKQMEEELRSRNVKCINFYDICLDYILIDSFEDLESPPSSVLAVMKNRWLSNSFKESALQTAIWSVFQAKRRLLQYPDGFKAKFYNVSEILTPALAWAFFGPDEDLARLVNDFKEQVKTKILLQILCKPNNIAGLGFPDRHIQLSICRLQLSLEPERVCDGAGQEQADCGEGEAGLPRQWNLLTSQLWSSNCSWQE